MFCSPAEKVNRSKIGVSKALVENQDLVPGGKPAAIPRVIRVFAAGPPCLLNKPIGQGPIHSLDGPRLRSSFHEMSVAHHRLSYDQDDEEAEESVEDEEEHEEQEEQDRMHGERLLN